MRWAFGMVWSGVIEVDGRWMEVNGRGMREGGIKMPTSHSGSTGYRLLLLCHFSELTGLLALLGHSSLASAPTHRTR